MLSSLQLSATLSKKTKEKTLKNTEETLNKVKEVKKIKRMNKIKEAKEIMRMNKVKEVKEIKRMNKVKEVKEIKRIKEKTHLRRTAILELPELNSPLKISEKLKDLKKAFIKYYTLVKVFCFINLISVDVTWYLNLIIKILIKELKLSIIKKMIKKL